MNPQEEIVQIVDAQNQPIDAVPRKVMREQGLIHRATYILVFNDKGELFTQKRTLTKDIYPGCWEIAAGGVVLADESYELSAERELAEELGVSNIPLTFHVDQYFEDSNNRVWGRIFTCVHNGPFQLQEEEIICGQFMTTEAILKLSTKEAFTPDSIEILQKIKAGIPS